MKIYVEKNKVTWGIIYHLIYMGRGIYPIQIQQRELETTARWLLGATFQYIGILSGNNRADGIHGLPFFMLAIYRRAHLKVTSYELVLFWIERRTLLLPIQPSCTSWTKNHPRPRGIDGIHCDDLIDTDECRLKKLKTADQKYGKVLMVVIRIEETVDMVHDDGRLWY